MKYSQFPFKTQLEPPKDADSVNAKLLSQGSFVDKLAAGIYTFLPMGKRVLSKIDTIIREEMNRIGGQEIFMPVLHPRELWTKTGRDEGMDEILYRTKGAGDHDFILGPSHEEIVTPLLKKFIRSYKDLPCAVYQIQTKFRNEPRAKSGILRGREFGMKDLYSFHADAEDLNRYYQKAIQAYFTVFKRCGLDAYISEASGGAFSKEFSHEFAVKTKAGEDTMLLCESCRFAQNAEIAEGKSKCPKCGHAFIQEKAIEAGNIFKLGTKFSEYFGLTYLDRDGKEKLVSMGCYGIGNTRLLGTIVEASHDDKGIIWPREVAPFSIHLLHLGSEEQVLKETEKIYNEASKLRLDVLYDDRDESAGKKLHDADLLGIPLRVLLSKKTLEKKSVEVKPRHEKEVKLMPLENLFDSLASLLS